MARNLQQHWMRAMRDGDFERAWQISDAIMEARRGRSDGERDSRLPRHCQTIWNGQSLAAKHVLVRCYHGLGDTVQFIRFARPLRAIAREVSVWVQPPLQRLTAGVAGVDRVLPLHDGLLDLDHDADIEVMELAHALRIATRDLPGPVPYLLAKPDGSDVPRDADFTVGLVWSGGDWDLRRSLHFCQLNKLLAIPGIRFVSLQRGSAARQCQGRDIADLGSGSVDTFAARLRALDVLVSIDTFAAHLAGALGVRVWTLLHSDCDWRWSDRGNETVWYPTMRLFRQTRPGDWTTVVEQVAEQMIMTRNDARRKQGTKRPA